MKTIPLGQVRNEVFYATPEHLASAMGNHGVDVVATTSIILYFETACNNLAMPYYDQAEISVGTHVSVDHLAPAKGSDGIQVTALLAKQSGRRLEFDVTAQQGDTMVMTGKHHRAVMNRDRFSTAGQGTKQEAIQIEFWFDFHSPWCYFASHQIGAIAQQANVQISWRPVHLANLIDAVDGRRPLEANRNFVDWYKQDLKDTAILSGLPYDPHKEYPKRPSRVLRAAIYAAEQDLAEPFIKSIMRGYWSEQKDISDSEWVVHVGRSVGLNGNDLLAAMTDIKYKAVLAKNLEDAQSIKLFGLPASVVNGRIFWGNDRLPLLRHYLLGRSPKL